MSATYGDRNPITPAMVAKCRENMKALKGKMVMVPLRVKDEEEEGKRAYSKVKTCPALLIEVYPHGIYTDEGFFQWFDIITRN
jgi:hypothetical protein